MKTIIDLHQITEKSNIGFCVVNTVNTATLNWRPNKNIAHLNHLSEPSPIESEIEIAPFLKNGWVPSAEQRKNASRTTNSEDLFDLLGL